ncbi:MAG TPA: glycoside hydrolase family 16 protein [Polyangiaceae bacterium]|jgi:beta-glucanase (GH16 family)
MRCAALAHGSALFVPAALAALVASTGACSSSSEGVATQTDGGGAEASVRDGGPGPGDATSSDAKAHDGAASDASGGDAGASDAQPAGDAAIGDGGWQLLWSDEFDEAGAPDPSKWTFTSLGTATSGPGWGIEYDSPGAVQVSGGMLSITATQGPDGGVVSGAIDSKGKFQQAYGRFEARMKAPPGAGVWPAFWLMGDTNGQGWPTCGEIDIVEIVGSAPKNAYGTVHSGNTSDASQNTATGGIYTSPGADLSADFHVYAVEWSASEADFYVDTDLYETITPSTLTAGQLWAFDHAFYVLFDLAIGGSWAGPPTASTFPAPMLVDYVRVYRKE